MIIFQYYINKILKKYINKKKPFPEGKYRQYVVKDLLKQNYTATKPLAIVGVDGTWMMPIISDQVRKALVEIAYDFYSDKVISAVLAQIEDDYSVGKVITDI